VSVQAVAVVEPRVGARQKQALAGAWLVSAATLGSGILTYAFHVLAARTLGADAYGKVAVLWAAMFLAAVVLYRPVEQTISRALADRMTRGEEVRSVLRTGGLACAAAIVLPVAAVLAGRKLVGDRLFEGDRSLASMLALGIALYGVAYFGRGVFGGMRWFPGYAAALLADTAGRFLLAVPLVVVASTSLAAASVTAGGIAGILLPAVVGRARLRRLVARTEGEPFALAAAARFAAPAALIAAADQLLVNGGPLLVVVAGGGHASKTAGVVFAATMLVRVPVFVFQGLAASLLPNLTHLHANGEGARFRRAVAAAAGIFLAIGVVIVAGAAAIGPEALRAVYGPGFEAGRGPLALLGAGVGCYLAASTLSQALLARASTARAAGAWAATAGVFVGLYSVTPGAPLLRIAIAFSSAALVSLVLLAVGLAREVRR
jgi:O-antigen/teichoic acid export membrane protein